MPLEIIVQCLPVSVQASKFVSGPNLELYAWRLYIAQQPPQAGCLLDPSCISLLANAEREGFCSARPTWSFARHFARRTTPQGLVSTLLLYALMLHSL